VAIFHAHCAHCLRHNPRWTYSTEWHVVLAHPLHVDVDSFALTVRLAGFETITSLEEDFNITQSFWLDRVIPNALTQRQDLCQPLFLKMGDSFVTNTSMFLWDLELVTNANHSSSGLIYKGSTLEGCDVTALYLNGNMNPPTLDVTAVTSCKDLDDFDVIAKTAFPLSVMPGTYTRFTGKQSDLSDAALHYRLLVTPLYRDYGDLTNLFGLPLQDSNWSDRPPKSHRSDDDF